MKEKDSCANCYLPWIDTLRFVAAFMVLFSHSRNDFFVPYNELSSSMQGWGSMLFYLLGRLGHEAVIIFFVLSGFLVGGRGLERINSGTFLLKDYCIDRTVRIGIPLVSAILLYYAVSLFLGFNFNWLVALGNLFSLQGICCSSLVSPFWSLSYEVWFYIILAAYSLIVAKKLNGFLLFVLCCLIFSYLKSGYLLIWLIGAMAYFIKPKKCLLIKWGSFFIMWVFIILLQLTTESNAMGDLVFKFNRLVLEIGMALFTALFIQQIIQCYPTRNWTLRLDRIGTHLAAFSYTLYLCHRIVFLPLYAYVFKEGEGTLNFNDILLYILLLTITIIVCYMIYLISEKHTKSIKKFVKNLLITQIRTKK